MEKNIPVNEVIDEQVKAEKKAKQLESLIPDGANWSDEDFKTCMKGL